MDQHEEILEGIGDKPILRGWLHPFASLASLAVTIFLLARTMGDTPRLVSMAIFGGSLVLMFTVSSIYHIGSWEPRVRKF